jgi:hypothetical protein
MRETRSSGSVEGVISDGHSYSDSLDERPDRTTTPGCSDRETAAGFLQAISSFRKRRAWPD